MENIAFNVNSLQEIKNHLFHKQLLGELECF